MKKFSVIGHWPLCASLIAGGLLMMAPQAHAAHWEMSYRPDGTDTPQTKASHWDETVNRDWFRPDLNDPNPHPVAGRLRATGDQVSFGSSAGDITDRTEGPSPIYPAISATSKGSITIYLKWVQDPNDATFVPAPKLVLLKIWGSATAGAGDNTGKTTVESKFGDKAGTEATYPEDDGNGGTAFYRYSTASVDENHHLYHTLKCP